MKKLSKSLLLASLIYLLTITPAMQAQSNNATVQIKVLQSRLSQEASGMKGSVDTSGMLQIEAVIDGQTYWLESGLARNGLLKPGEYPGKLVKDKGKVPYKVNQEWQLIYSDGKHENFNIVAIVAK